MKKSAKKQKHERVVSVRLTEKEYQLLSKSAQQEGRTLSAYIRREAMMSQLEGDV